jgi:hypothetical protein
MNPVRVHDKSFVTYRVLLLHQMFENTFILNLLVLYCRWLCCRIMCSVGAQMHACTCAQYQQLDIALLRLIFASGMLLTTLHEFVNPDISSGIGIRRAHYRICENKQSYQKRATKEGAAFS